MRENIKGKSLLTSFVYFKQILKLTKFWIPNSIYKSERVYVYDIKIGKGKINHNLCKTDKTQKLHC